MANRVRVYLLRLANSDAAHPARCRTVLHAPPGADVLREPAPPGASRRRGLTGSAFVAAAGSAPQGPGRLPPAHRPDWSVCRRKPGWPDERRTRHRALLAASRSRQVLRLPAVEEVH